MRYLEDLVLDDPFACGSFVLSREEIVGFARQFDPQPFHLDEAAAQRSYFAGLCASGVHTQAAAIGLLVRRLNDLAVVAGGALHQASFLVPVRPGLRYSVTARWTQARPSARTPSRGVADVAGVATDGEGRDVMRFGVTYILARRPAAGG